MAYTRPFPVDAALTAIAIGYKNPAIAMIADRMLPRRPVGGEKFSWTEHPVGMNFTVPDTEVGRRGRVARVEVSGIERTDAVNDHGLEDAIPVSDINEAERMRAQGLGNFNPVDTATENLTNLMQIGREIRVAKIVQDPASYSASRVFALSGADKFTNYGGAGQGASPIDIIKSCIQAPLIFRPNTMAMSQGVFDMLTSHPDLVKATRGSFTGIGIVTKEEIAKLFSIDNLLVGAGYANAARPGQPVNLQRIWGNNISFAYIDPQSRPEDGMTFGMTAEYGTRIAQQWFDKDVGLQGGQVVRVGERVKELITAPDVGCLLMNVI